jgi:hypothetical protein
MNNTAQWPNHTLPVPGQNAIIPYYLLVIQQAHAKLRSFIFDRLDGQTCRAAKDFIGYSSDGKYAWCSSES